MWSEISITTLMSCSINRIEMACSLRMNFNSALSSALSRAFKPAAGSSRQSSTGSVHMARAISRRRRPGGGEPVARLGDRGAFGVAVNLEPEQAGHGETRCRHQHVVLRHHQV